MRIAVEELLTSTTACPEELRMDVSVEDPLLATEAFVKVTLPKFASADWPQLGSQTVGASAIHSAELWAGGGDGSGTFVVNVQPSVEFVSVNVQAPAV